MNFLYDFEARHKKKKENQSAKPQTKQPYSMQCNFDMHIVTFAFAPLPPK
jgi:hypothetical protein